MINALSVFRPVSIAVLLAAVAGAQPTASWTIETFPSSTAGTQLNTPRGVALDASGNLYIVDNSNHSILKMDSTGSISRVAGTGTQGFGGDGGAATTAQLNSPTAVAPDAAGNLYIADTYNNRVRKVDTAGVITTVAGDGTRSYGGDGGAATSAQLNRPISLALDGSGNLYIADVWNNRIRMVNSSGNISTVAGDGTSGFSGDGGAATEARLFSPFGVALDGSGNLYIADAANHRIRRVSSTGTITTVAGDGSESYGGDGGAATSAQLSTPSDVVLDGSGNLYIVDQNNHRIRKVSSTGTITTVAGTGAAGYSEDGGAATEAQLNSPAGLAVDGSGNLYIADLDNHRIRKVDSAGIISTIVGDGLQGDSAAAAAQLRLRDPYGVTLDGLNNLYIADMSNHRIIKVSSTGTISTVAGDGTEGFSGDGGAATAAQLNAPTGVTLDNAGSLYIADWGNNRIRRVDSAGVISTVAGDGTQGFSGDGASAAAARLNAPIGVTSDGSGNLYIADTNNHRIRKITIAPGFALGILTTGTISTVAGSGTASYGGDGGAATAAQLNAPSAVASDAAGNLYIADTDNHRIRMVNSAGNISTVAGSGTAGFSGNGGAATAAQLNAPSGLALDRSGNLYIADAGNHRIRMVNSAGVISTVAGSGTAGFDGDGGAAVAAPLNSPRDVALDRSGRLYIADKNNNRIRRVKPPTAQPGLPIGQPAVRTLTVGELVFVLRQDDAPATQEAVLYAENGAADFRVESTQPWITFEPSSGSLSVDEEAVITVTVNPVGLRVGQHDGQLHVRSGGRLTARVNIALTVNSPAGPTVSEFGVVNAAVLSAFGERGPFGAAPLPLAPGSLVVLRGENFTDGESFAAESFPLPTSLGGVSVQFDDLEAPLIAVQPQFIQAQMPSQLGREALEAGLTPMATVVVQTAEGSSYPRSFVVAPYAPGVFAVRISDGDDVSRSAARAGDILEIYGTGLGPVEPPLADGMNSCAPDGVCRYGAGANDRYNVVLRRTTARPRVTIGGVEVAGGEGYEDGVLFSGMAPTLAAVNLVVVRVPAGIAPSDAAEVIITIGGKRSQSGVTIAVE